MNFIALVIALLIERLLGEHERLRAPVWYRRYVVWLRGAAGNTAAWSGPLGVLLLVGIPTALVGIVYVLLGGALLSVLALVFSVLVLLYCLGPRELDAEVSRYLDAVDAGDEARAAEFARDIVGGSAPAGGAARNRAVAEAVLLQFNLRTFAVLFWFVVLGPLGAVMYRTTALARADAEDGTEPDQAFALSARRLHGILDWIPARLIALGFALAGSFEDAVTDWKSYYDRKSDLLWEVNADVIAATGRGALRMGDMDEADHGDGSAGVGAVRSALALVLRTLVFWVVLYGLLTIAGLAI